MVVWYTQDLRRDGCSFMWHQPCRRCKYTTSVDIQKMRRIALYKRSSINQSINHSTKRVLELGGVTLYVSQNKEGPGTGWCVVYVSQHKESWNWVVRGLCVTAQRESWNWVVHNLSDTLGLVTSTKPAPCGTRAAQVRCVTVHDTDGFRVVRLGVT